MAANVGVTARVVSNRFPALSRKLRRDLSDAIEDLAQDIARDAKAGCPSKRVSGTITVRRRSDLGRSVIAGDKGRAFHAGFLEYGTIDQGPRPFMTPAAEAGRVRVSTRLSGLLR
jgi:HK97 gp10 family phage protein